MRARLAFAVAALKHGWSPVLPPWSRLRRDPSPAARLRRIACQRLLGLAPAPDRALFVGLAALWPAWCRIAALREVRRNHRWVTLRHGVGRVRQWRDAARVAARFNLLPSAYYEHALWDDPERAARLVQSFELLCAFGRLNGAVDDGPLSDKRRFDAAGRAAGVPVPPLIAAFSADGEWWNNRPTGDLPRTGLFIKLVEGLQGRGAERWSYDPAAGRWVRRSVALDAAAFAEHCRARGRVRAILLQQALVNHPDMARFSLGALCTLRVVTCRDPGTAPDVIAATIKAPRGNVDVDNLHFGGITAAVDPATGLMRAAISGDPAEGTFERHPDTGAPIKGATLETAPALVALALCAHERLPTPWTVGWDVTMTPDGPVIVEGNALWGAGIIQQVLGVPLGDTPFATRLLARLAAARA